MKTSDKLLRAYYAASIEEDRQLLTTELLRMAPVDGAAVEALLYILNDENSSAIRRLIVRLLKEIRPRIAVHALAKAMFDPDPFIRTHAAIALAEYDDTRLLAGSLGPLLDALPDPATRHAAERAIRAISGKSADKINASERERIRQGERADTLWPEHFALLPLRWAATSENDWGLLDPCMKSNWHDR